MAGNYALHKAVINWCEDLNDCQQSSSGNTKTTFNISIQLLVKTNNPTSFDYQTVSKLWFRHSSRTLKYG